MTIFRAGTGLKNSDPWFWISVNQTRYKYSDLWFWISVNQTRYKYSDLWFWISVNQTRYNSFVTNPAMNPTFINIYLWRV